MARAARPRAAARLSLLAACVATAAAAALWGDGGGGSDRGGSGLDASAPARAAWPWLAEAHTWLLEPPSHFDIFPRGGVADTPCDPWTVRKQLKVKAGSELRLGWAPMGHAGGYVRVALVRKDALSRDFGEFSPDDDEPPTGAGTEDDAKVFDQAVVRYACYGGGNCADCVVGGTKGGEGSGGPPRGQPYSTNITIPSNLADGIYVLQLWAVGTGAGIQPTFSCTDLDISGGDTSITCPATTAWPPAYDANATGLQSCWSCAKLAPADPNCKTPHARLAAEGGAGSNYGRFCYPSPAARLKQDPPPASSKTTLLGYARHQVGSGDTLVGVARAYDCCCTPREIMLASGWGDAKGIWDIDKRLLRVGDILHVPVYKGRLGCTPRDPNVSGAAARQGPGSAAGLLAHLGLGLAAAAAAVVTAAAASSRLL